MNKLVRITKHVGKALFKSVVVLTLTVLLWLAVSVVDVSMHNTHPQDGDPHPWNAFVLLLESAEHQS